jgi:hypothetical protein
MDFDTDSEAHDRCFRAMVYAALVDPEPVIPHDYVEAYFAARRASIGSSSPDRTRG